MSSEDFSKNTFLSDTWTAGILLGVGALIGLLMAANADDSLMAFHGSLFAGASLLGLFFTHKASLRQSGNAYSRGWRGIFLQ